MLLSLRCGVSTGDMAIYDKESMELLIKRVGVDNVFFATEMFGATNAVDPKTGRRLDHAHHNCGCGITAHYIYGATPIRGNFEVHRRGSWPSERA